MTHEDFDIESLAAYLHLSPAKVSKMVERSKLPGRKVGGQWRFAPAEIHHWLEQRIGASDDDELVRVEDALQQARGPGQAMEVSLAALLPLGAIAIPLPARTRNSVITSMVELAAGSGLLWDPQAMAKAVRAREDLYPTALENGVALLHPRRPMAKILAQPLLALGRTDAGIPFGVGVPLTDIFFLICSTEDRGHLQILARLSRVLTVQGFLDALREVADAPAAHQLIATTEKWL